MENEEGDDGETFDESEGDGEAELDVGGGEAGLVVGGDPEDDADEGVGVVTGEEGEGCEFALSAKNQESGISRPGLRDIILKGYNVSLSLANEAECVSLVKLVWCIIEMRLS